MTSNKARLAFLTTPDGKLILNLQTEESPVFDESNYARIELTDDQLAGLVLEGARAVLGRRAGK